jgi:hypothetical protein
MMLRYLFPSFVGGASRTTGFLTMSGKGISQPSLHMTAQHLLLMA